MTMEELLNMNKAPVVAPRARDEQEICFISLPIPKVKPHVSEVLIQTPTDGYFYILLNGTYVDGESSAWMYIADDRGKARQFVDRSEIIVYLTDLKFKGYDLNRIRVIQEFDFNKGGEFDAEKTYSKVVSKKRARGYGKNWPK